MTREEITKKMNELAVELSHLTVEVMNLEDVNAVVVDLVIVNVGGIAQVGLNVKTAEIKITEGEGIPDTDAIQKSASEQVDDVLEKLRKNRNQN